MPKAVAICNQKGGVGKTTTAVNLSAALALSGVRTLLIDLDPQANATGGLGVERNEIDRSIYQAILGGFPPDSLVIPTQVAGLSLIPSHVSLSGAEVELVGVFGREVRLKEILVPLRESHEAILIDCPPSLGLLTVNALTAADSVLIPLQCEYYALEGLSQLLETIRLVQRSLNPQLAIEGVLLTMADFRTKLTSDVIEEVRRYFESKVYDVVIPRSVRLSEAPSRGLPIALYDPGSVGARAYQNLAERIKENLHVRDARIGQGDTSFDSGEKPGLPGGEPGSEQGAGSPDSTDGDPTQPVPTSSEA